MKGSPHKMGTIQGTSGHASALKQSELADIKARIELATAQELETQTLETIKANNKVREKAAKKEAVKEELKTKGVKDDQGMYILGEMEKADTEYDPSKDYSKPDPDLNLSPEAAKKAEKKNKKKLKPLIEADAKAKADADAKAKIDATRGTERGQVKKQGKLDKIQQKNKNKLDNITGKIDQRTQELDALIKSGEGLEGEERAKNIAARDKLSNKIRNLSEKKMRKEEKPPSRREERLKKEVNMTPEEYKANQAKKAQTWQDEMSRAALTIPRGSDPADVIAFDESVRTRDARDETTKVDNEYKKLLTKTGAEAYNTKQQELLALQNLQKKNDPADG